MGGTKRGIYIFAGIILSLFIITTAYLTVSIVVSLKNGPVRAEQNFIQISKSVNSVLFFDSNAQSAREFQNKALGNKYIAALLICSGEYVVFAYPSSSDMISDNEAGMPSVKSSSPFIKIFSATVPTAANDKMVLTAALYTLHPSDIYDPARRSFLIILSCTLSVFVVLLYLSKLTATTPVGEEKTDNVFPQPTNYGFPSEKILLPSVSRESDFVLEPKREVEAESSFNTAAEFKHQNRFKPEFTQVQNTDEDLFRIARSHNKTGVPDKQVRESADQENISDPMGLFSPATGVGWESYMETRLDSELVRAASSEQDLALVFLRIKGIENNTLMMKRVAAVLLDFFKFRDFIFEYKKDGFAGILLNINLDQTMVLVETIYSQINELLESENIHSKFAIGISTRSLRLLPGSRLINETAKALQKAFDETGMPIVAFRVNPDKYRQFVADAERKI